MNLAVIPARGGSKRIPKKNIKDFLGKPIIAYSIEAAIKSNLFDDIIVSTDDKEIAEIAEKYGAKVPFVRPENLSDDFIGTTPIISHAANWYGQHIKKPENICCIYATAPFVQCDYIEQGLKALQTIEQGIVYSVTTFSFPIQRAQKMNKDNSLTPFNPEYMASRSQDLDEAYHDAGQFYWWTEKSLSQGVKESKGIILPRYRVQDIDTMEDWKRAELMYQALV